MKKLTLIKVENGKAIVVKHQKIVIHGMSKQVEEEVPNAAVIAITRREAFRNWQASDKLMNHVANYIYNPRTKSSWRSVKKYQGITAKTENV